MYVYLLETLKILEGALNHDPKQAAAYAQQLAEKLEADGHQREARRIQRLLSGKGNVQLKAAKLEHRQRRLPADGESRLPLADEHFVRDGDAPIVLPRSTAARLDEFLSFATATERLVEYGLAVSPSLLIYGPPGCGKTQLARHIAGRLKLPLIIGRSDALISSFLGSTAKNLRTLFEHASLRPCVLFMDEFDSVAKLRDDRQELGELKRVVVSLLQNIDALHGQTIFVAATNHEHLLDPAIWRRFAFKIHLDLPSHDARASLFQHFLTDFCDRKEIARFAEAAENLTGDDIRRVSEDAKRRAILDGATTVSEVDILHRIADTRLEDHGEEKAISERVKLTKYLSPGVYTNRRLAQMYGISVGHVSNLLRKEDSNA